MCSTIFTLTSLTSNPQFWHVPIQPSLFYTFRNYILRNSRHFFSSPFLHHSFCFIYKNYFSQSLKQKHWQFCLNTTPQNEKNMKLEMQYQNQMWNKKKLLWRIPTLNSARQLQKDDLFYIPTELKDDAHRAQAALSYWCKACCVWVQGPLMQVRAGWAKRGTHTTELPVCSEINHTGHVAKLEKLLLSK